MFITIDKYRINYQIINENILDKPMLIFLHEGLGSIGQWKNFPDELCKETKQSGLVYERYGHGQSSSLTGNRTIDYMHQEAYYFLPKILSKFQINKPVILVGHSDGASIALLFASKFPNMVLMVVSIAAHVMVEECTVRGVEQTISLYKDFDLKYLLEKYHHENTDSMFYGWANAWTSPEFTNWNICNEISNINCPILLIQGKNDEYATLKQIDTIVSNTSAITEKLILSDCGHSPHLQQKETVLVSINDFIRKYQ